MKLEIVQPNELTNNASDVVLVDFSNYGSFYVAKNVYGATNFFLPAKYLGDLILQPDSVPMFHLAKKSPTPAPLDVPATPAVVSSASDQQETAVPLPAASRRPPV